MGFHRWTHMYNKKYRRFHQRGVSIPACYYPTHIFIFMYTTVQPCWTLSHRTEPTQLNTNVVLIITMHSHPFHAMSPCICNAMCHFMPIPCHIYDECYMDNSTHAYHPCIMENYINMHKISKRSYISCQYICTHIY